MTVITPQAPKYSHITQKLLNYFPDTDLRIRENPVSLGAQLLNAVAFQMEQQNTRITRELRALNLSDVPMNIDNGGVYFGARVPLSFNLPIDSQGNLLPPTQVKGQIPGGALVTLTAYNDFIPVPTRATQDLTIPAVSLTNPQLINITGDGNPKSFAPGQMPIPNFLTFTIQGMGPVTVAISISITGETDPPAVWPQDVQTKNEVLVISDDGLYQTDSVWSSISDITITGLPVNCQLIAYSVCLGLSAEPDTDRPFTHFGYRGISFPRYWQLDDVLLLDVYKRNRFAGLETYQAYHLPEGMVDLAVEPNTSGLFLTDGTNLIYLDRRSPMPGSLSETGVTVEPAFGLSVVYDYSKQGDTTYAAVSTMPLSNASTVTQYRYVVEDPNGNLFVLLPSGVLSQYSGTSGWTQGTPTPVSFPLTVQGTYIVSLEMLGSFNAKTTDTVPFINPGISSLATVSLADVVPQVQGIAFDAYDKLWAWTGSFLIPIKLSYDAFTWDPGTRTIYATDKYSSVTIS